MGQTGISGARRAEACPAPHPKYCLLALPALVGFSRGLVLLSCSQGRVSICMSERTQFLITAGPDGGELWERETVLS